VEFDAIEGSRQIAVGEYKGGFAAIRPRGLLLKTQRSFVGSRTHYVAVDRLEEGLDERKQAPASLVSEHLGCRGGAVSGECLRLGLADEVRYSILPILIGDGIPFFERLDRDIPLHLTEVKAYKSDMVGLRYEVSGESVGSRRRGE
jgi:dihydrofolate reductase